MSTEKVFFHVGLPKSASTWAQSVAFPQLKSINYIGRKYDLTGFNSKDGKPPKVRDDVNDTLTHLSKAHPHSFDKERVVEIIGKKLSNTLPNVLSTEQLSEPSNYIQSAYRIKELFPESSIILFIRAQQSMIFSIYLNELRKGCIEKLSDLINPASENGQRIIGTPEIWLDHFNYLKMFQIYEGIFGEGKVLVLPIELIRDDTKTFAERLTSFLEVGFDSVWLDQMKSSISVNKGGSYMEDSLGWLFMNRLNYILPGFIANHIQTRHKGIVKSTRWVWKQFENKQDQLDILEAVKNKFSKPNEELSKKINIELSELGYYVQLKQNPI